MFARAREYHHTGGFIVAKAERGMLDLFDMAVVQGIGLVRPVKGHGGDLTAALHLDMLIVHVPPPSLLSSKSF